MKIAAAFYYQVHLGRYTVGLASGWQIPDRRSSEERVYGTAKIRMSAVSSNSNEASGHPISLFGLFAGVTAKYDGSIKVCEIKLGP